MSIRNFYDVVKKCLEIPLSFRSRKHILSWICQKLYAMDNNLSPVPCLHQIYSFVYLVHDTVMKPIYATSCLKTVKMLHYIDYVNSMEKVTILNIWKSSVLSWSRVRTQYSSSNEAPYRAAILGSTDRSRDSAFWHIWDDITCRRDSVNSF